MSVEKILESMNEEFRYHISINSSGLNKFIRHEKSRFLGGLNIEVNDPKCSISLQECEFEGDLRIYGSNLSRINLRKCTVTGNVYIHSSQISEEVEVSILSCNRFSIHDAKVNNIRIVSSVINERLAISNLDIKEKYSDDAKENSRILERHPKDAAELNGIILSTIETLACDVLPLDYFSLRQNQINSLKAEEINYGKLSTPKQILESFIFGRPFASTHDEFLARCCYSVDRPTILREKYICRDINKMPREMRKELKKAICNRISIAQEDYRSLKKALADSQDRFNFLRMQAGEKECRLINSNTPWTVRGMLFLDRFVSSYGVNYLRVLVFLIISILLFGSMYSGFEVTKESYNVSETIFGHSGPFKMDYIGGLKHSFQTAFVVGNSEFKFIENEVRYFELLQHLVTALLLYSFIASIRNNLKA